MPKGHDMNKCPQTALYNVIGHHYRSGFRHRINTDGTVKQAVINPNNTEVEILSYLRSSGLIHTQAVLREYRVDPDRTDMSIQIERKMAGRWSFVLYLVNHLYDTPKIGA